MQKVLDFLEKYCQWLAVGIAAVFFLFALWQYLPGISEPVKVSLDNTTYGPGSADLEIKERADSLQARLSSSETISATVPQYSKQVDGDLRGANAKPLPPVAASSFISTPFKVPAEWPMDVPRDGDNANSSDTKIASLPVIPAAVIDPAPTTGFAQVAPAAVAGQPAAVPAPQAGAAGAVASQDVTWVRVPYTIPMQLLRVSFGGVGIPPALSKTSVVNVELIRQRQLPGDAWGPEEVVKRLPTVQLQDMPAEGSPPAVMNAYRQWADQNQAALIQPPFYQILGGEDPNVSKPVEAVATTDIFDATTFPRNGDLSKLTAEQKKAVMEDRARRAREDAAQRRGNRPQPGPRGGRGGGGVEGDVVPQQALPAAADRSGKLAQPMQNRPAARPPVANYPQGAGPGADGDPGLVGGMGGGMPMPAQPGQPMPAQPGQPIQLAPVPAAPFDVSTAGAPDIQGIAYDTSAQGDATYRYRIRYSVANPIYQVQNVASNPQLINQFALVGEDKSKWSEPIQIAPLTHIFLAVQPQPNAANVRFTVYRWQGGKQHRASQSFSPGDSIGKVEGDIDFRTPWTLVEVRRDSTADGPYAVLMNQEGRLRRQTFTADNASPEQKQLAAQVDAGLQANGAAPGTPPAAGNQGVTP